MTHLIWWAIGTLGIGGALFAGAILILGWPVVVQFFIGTKIGRALLAIGGATAAVFIALAKARQQGAAAERARQEKENADFHKAQTARDAAIAGSTDAALDDSLRDHSGKPGAGP